MSDRNSFLGKAGFFWWREGVSGLDWQAGDVVLKGVGKENASYEQHKRANKKRRLKDERKR